MAAKMVAAKIDNKLKSIFNWLVNAFHDFYYCFLLSKYLLQLWKENYVMNNSLIRHINYQMEKKTFKISKCHKGF